MELLAAPLLLSFARLRLRGGAGGGVSPLGLTLRQADRPHPNPSPEEEGLKCFTAWPAQASHPARRRWSGWGGELDGYG